MLVEILITLGVFLCCQCISYTIWYNCDRKPEAGMLSATTNILAHSGEFTNEYSLIE